MKKTVKNAIIFLIFMNTINLFSQKRKQDIVYEEPSRFIESPLAVGKAAPSQVSDKIMLDKNQNSFLDTASLASLEKEEINNALITQLIKLLISQKNSLKVIASETDVKKSGMIIYHKDDVTAIIVGNSPNFHPEDYLKELVTLYREENK